MKRLLGSIALGLLAAAPVAASEWQILSLNDNPTEGDATISCGPDGAVIGSTGCNQFNASATIEAGRLIVAEPIATTRMACPGDALTRQEDTILAALAEPLGVTVDLFIDQVTLSGVDTTLVLAPFPTTTAAANVPRPHFGRDKPVGDPPYLSVFGLAHDLLIRAEATNDASALSGVPSGTVLRNDGCDGGWCKVELPDGSLAGWAEAQYLEPAGSALRAGQEIFDATGMIPCAKGVGTPMRQCSFGVAREGNGTATVVVATAASLTRVLFFQDGAFLSTDASEAAGGFDTSVTREADLNFLRIDDERYEIPDALIFGG